MENLQTIKQRFGIIGNDMHLNRALEKAIRVAPTDISVLVTGESGVGKESIPKIIHHLSHRKHAKYIAVNCGAIPEGTIDSELFGHEKGAFTGATTARKGYFEVADGGTIFLDEVGELPLTTQVRLLRVLENGEFIKVGSSNVQKTNVRMVAATNINLHEAISKGKFREDLYYRLSTIEINLPPLRKRVGDIHLLFRKFASDFAQKYKMPTVRLTDEAVKSLENYGFPGNIRQLKNIAEQISIVEENRVVNAAILLQYLPTKGTNLPSIISQEKNATDFATEREIMYKILFDMRNDINDLKKLTLDLMQSNDASKVKEDNKHLIQKIYHEDPKNNPIKNKVEVVRYSDSNNDANSGHFEYAETIDADESLLLEDKEIELIKKSLERNNGKRKLAATELGISERTLYRKIKQYNL